MYQSLADLSLASDQTTSQQVVDKRSGVRTTLRSGPAEYITDPALFKAGITAHKQLLGTDDEQETLHTGTCCSHLLRRLSQC